MSYPSNVEEEGKRAVEERVQTAREFVSDRPLIAVAIAAALGFIVGQFIF